MLCCIGWLLGQPGNRVYEVLNALYSPKLYRKVPADKLAGTIAAERAIDVLGLGDYYGNHGFLSV